jgi:hypothetical protein
MGYQSRINLEKDENDDLFADSHIIFKSVEDLLFSVTECA